MTKVGVTCTARSCRFSRLPAAPQVALGTLEIQTEAITEMHTVKGQPYGIQSRFPLLFFFFFFFILVFKGS